jgi:hypothetical protein
MPRLPRAFNVQPRRDSGTFILTLNPPSGLPLSVCAEWRRKSFAHLPDELALYRNPETKTAAENAAIALIQHLKHRLTTGAASVSTETVKVGPWLERFISLDDNPRAARIMGAGSPYSIETIELYRVKYLRYIKGDPFCRLKMAEIEQTHALAFMARMGLKEKDDRHGGGAIAGTYTYEIVLKFVRMAFGSTRRPTRAGGIPLTVSTRPGYGRHGTGTFLRNGRSGSC